jgi:hypothetical protein
MHHVRRSVRVPWLQRVDFGLRRDPCLDKERRTQAAGVSEEDVGVEPVPYHACAGTLKGGIGASNNV